MFGSRAFFRSLFLNQGRLKICGIWQQGHFRSFFQVTGTDIFPSLFNDGRILNRFRHGGSQAVLQQEGGGAKQNNSLLSQYNECVKQVVIAISSQYPVFIGSRRRLPAESSKFLKARRVQKQRVGLLGSHPKKRISALHRDVLLQLMPCGGCQPDPGDRWPGETWCQARVRHTQLWHKWWCQLQQSPRSIQSGPLR